MYRLAMALKGIASIGFLLVLFLKEPQEQFYGLMVVYVLTITSWHLLHNSTERICEVGSVK